MQSDLLPDKHINAYLGTCRVEKNKKLEIKCAGKLMAKKIIITMIRPKVKYVEVVWSQHTTQKNWHKFTDESLNYYHK